MRLTKDKISFIKTELMRLAPNGQIFLFGSRVMDESKGGDIDILLLTEKKLAPGKFREVRREFFKKFGWQKLDIVNLSLEDRSAFKELALNNAISL